VNRFICESSKREQNDRDQPTTSEPYKEDPLPNEPLPYEQSNEEQISGAIFEEEPFTGKSSKEESLPLKVSSSSNNIHLPCEQLKTHQFSRNLSKEELTSY